MFKKTLILSMVISMFGCGLVKPVNPIVEVNLLDALKLKQSRYLELLPSTQDEHGFIETDHCDSLLFSGLLGVATEVSIEAARDDSGAWHRRPIERPCYPEHSKSTVSRDMFMGLLWYMWKNDKLEMAEELFRYGQDHSWIMGEGDISRIYFTPGLQATLAEIIYRLGGKNHIIVRHIPQFHSKNTSFPAHLDVLHLLLRAELVGRLERLDIIEWQYKRNPHNALFSYAYHKYTNGNQNKTIRNLLNTDYFPEDELPTDCNRKEPWLWQRDKGSDWLPRAQCEGKKHSGGDLLFIAHLLLEDVGG